MFVINFFVIWYISVFVIYVVYFDWLEVVVVGVMDGVFWLWVGVI